MKKLISSLSVFLGVILFSSFTLTTSPKTSQLNFKNYGSQSFGLVTVSFSFTQNNCTYHVSATINTNDGSGFGYISQTCAGQNTRSIRFTIYGALVTVLKGKIIVSEKNLIDFIDETSNTDVDLGFPVREKIAEEITLQGDFD